MEVDDVRELKEFGATDAYDVRRDRKEENKIRRLVSELVREYENLATTLEENEALRARAAEAEQEAARARVEEQSAATKSAGLRVGVTKALEMLQDSIEDPDPGLSYAVRLADTREALTEQRRRAAASAQETRRLELELQAVREREGAREGALAELEYAAEDFFESRGGRELVRAYRVLEDKLFDAKHPEAAAGGAAEEADDSGARPF